MSTLGLRGQHDGHGVLGSGDRLTFVQREHIVWIDRTACNSRVLHLRFRRDGGAAAPGPNSDGFARERLLGPRKWLQHLDRRQRCPKPHGDTARATTARGLLTSIAADAATSATSTGASATPALARAHPNAGSGDNLLAWCRLLAAASAVHALALATRRHTRRRCLAAAVLVTRRLHRDVVRRLQPGWL